MGRFWRQEDLWLKVLSVLVALVIWVYVASRATPSPEGGWRRNGPSAGAPAASGSGGTGSR